MQPLADGHGLNRLFAGFTEQAFLAELGVTDVELIDYVSGLLARFVHRDQIFSVRSPRGLRLERIADMLAEAEQIDHRGERRRQIYKHVGDFALFWSGMFPEALARRFDDSGGVHCVTEQGKRSYFLASTYTDTADERRLAPVLRRLSDDFEACQQGLRRVREVLTVFSGDN
jgi:hypothetical protein